MAKSLESFNKEVDKWNFIDCIEYLEEHENDEVLANKVKIVRERIPNLIAKTDLKSAAYSIKNNALWLVENPDVDEELHKHFKKLAENSKPDERREAFSTWTLTEILSELKEVINQKFERYTDDYYKPAWNPSKGNSNTGLYLWANGYVVSRPIGEGGFGCIWECGGKAVKVIPDEENAQMESVSTKQIADLISKSNSSTKEKAKKYLNYLVSQGNSRILEGVLANTDLLKSAEERTKSLDGGLSQAEKKGKTKTINSLLRQGVQICKSLVMLHNLGFSHNDVKPQNFLKIDKSVLNAKKETKPSKDGKVHKHRTQLADFGSMTKIPQNSKERKEQEKTKLNFTSIFAPDDQISYDCRPSSVKKRDVFSLGASLLYLLLAKTKASSGPLIVKQIINSKCEDIYEKYELGKYYGGTSEKDMYDFLTVIKKMMKKSPSARPNIKTALKLLQKLRPKKQKV